MASDDISFQVLCGNCGAEVKIPEDAVDTDLFTCDCGNSDTIENITDIAGDAIVEYLAGSIDDGLQEATKGNPFVTFTAEAPTPRSRKFAVRPV